MKSSSLYVKHVNLLDLQPLHFVNGLKQIRLKLIKLHQDNTCIINKILCKLLMSFLILKKNKKSFIVELVLKNKWKIWKDNVTSYKKNFLIINLLQIVLLELIGIEKDFKPFWNTRCLENSKSLWLPTKIDLQDLDSNLSNGLLIKKEEKSKFWMKKKISLENKNLQKTSYPLSIYIPASKWVEDDILKTIKIRLYPNKEQLIILKEWFGTHRYVYNKTINEIKDNKTKINFQILRNKLVTYETRDGIINENIQKWEIKVPKEIRAHSVKDVVKGYKTGFSNLKNNNIKKFEMRYKSKKNKNDSIGIQKQSIKNIGSHYKIYNNTLGKIKIGNRNKKKFNELTIS